MAAMGQEGDDVDHYEVLRLPSGEEGAALSVEQIEKAYRTQSRLRHPDKRPDDPNATADFQSLASSYKFLRDESLRRQFDARLRGRREVAARAAATGVKRRKAVSDLEERERAFAAGGGPAVDPVELARREDKRKAADVKRELDEFFAAKKSGVSGSASTPAHGDKKGGTPENGPKTDKDIVIKTRKSKSKGSAIVVMASKEAAQTALKNHSVYNVFPVPLIVASVQESGGLPARSTQTPEPRTSNIDGTGFSDLEASVFRKLQEAQKRKKSG
ncbi:hypothetical protein CFC21_007067 [Triticum aestivum]|uniref:J domain-containing protein n=2 Tax=Triticum aestivum TaxID=4565 RepID=A0A3B5YZ71_WHEAT|nr:hypothetical protein CFC21_007067 [Triticum aestivum]